MAPLRPDYDAGKIEVVEDLRGVFLAADDIIYTKSPILADVSNNHLITAV